MIRRFEEIQRDIGFAIDYLNLAPILPFIEWESKVLIGSSEIGEIGIRVSRSWLSEEAYRLHWFASFYYKSPTLEGHNFNSYSFLWVPENSTQKESRFTPNLVVITFLSWLATGSTKNDKKIHGPEFWEPEEVTELRKEIMTDIGAGNFW
jgi:hypothetical protein